MIMCIWKLNVFMKLWFLFVCVLFIVGISIDITIVIKSPKMLQYLKINNDLKDLLNTCTYKQD